MIPFVDPSCEVIKAYPFKMVIDEDSIETYARYLVNQKDEDPMISKELDVDSIELVMKSSVVGLVMGKSIDHGDYMVKIYWGDRTQGFFFNTKSEAMELYVKLSKWRKAK